jgi:hypothetical protein
MIFIKKYTKFGFKWVLRNWLLLLIAYFSYMAMVDASAARGYSLRAMDYADDAASFAEDAADNSQEAVDEIDRVRRSLW